MDSLYLDNSSKIQTIIKQLSREFLYTTRPETLYMSTPAYASNFVAVSGGEEFDTELDNRVRDLMTEETD